MIILPAIDILNKKPVRLYQGDYEKQEVVGDSVLEIAKAFEQAGATYLHLVDLDGAKDGSLCNFEVIKEVVKAIDIPVEVGGGIRSMDSIRQYVDIGVARVILGTSALEDEAFLKEALASYEQQIVVGIDCKAGFVYGRGWLEESKREYREFAKEIEALGVKTVVVTDIEKDGTLQGPNIDMLSDLKNVTTMQIIASGGIHTLEDIKRLKELGMYGAITGKALYHNTLSLEKALKLCKEED